MPASEIRPKGPRPNGLRPSEICELSYEFGSNDLTSLYHSSLSRLKVRSRSTRSRAEVRSFQKLRSRSARSRAEFLCRFPVRSRKVIGRSFLSRSELNDELRPKSTIVKLRPKLGRSTTVVELRPKLGRSTTDTAFSIVPPDYKSQPP